MDAQCFRPSQLRYSHSLQSLEHLSDTSPSHCSGDELDANSEWL